MIGSAVVCRVWRELWSYFCLRLFIKVNILPWLCGEVGPTAKLFRGACEFKKPVCSIVCVGGVGSGRNEGKQAHGL